MQSLSLQILVYYFFDYAIWPNSPLLPPFSLFFLSLSSTGATSPLSLHAFPRPLFCPNLTSLLLAQQQHRPTYNNHPTIADADATHINAKILKQISGIMFTVSSAPYITFLKMINMTVAIIFAAVVVRAEQNAKMAMGKVAQRV